MGLGLVLIAMTGQRLILYPPLLVIAYELLVHPEHCPWRRRPIGTIAGCTLAAVTGTLLASSIGSKPLGTALTMVVVELLQRWLGFRMLPAFGAGLIPFLLPHAGPLYPASVALGTTLLAVVAWLMQGPDRVNGDGAGHSPPGTCTSSPGVRSTGLPQGGE